MNGSEYVIISATVKIKTGFGWRGCRRVADVLTEGCVSMFTFFSLSPLPLSPQSDAYSCLDVDNVMEEAEALSPLVVHYKPTGPRRDEKYILKGG